MCGVCVEGVGLNGIRIPGTAIGSKCMTSGTLA